MSRYSARWFYKRISSRVPGFVRKPWTKAITNINLQRGLPAPGSLINESELRPHYRQALLDLQERVGAEQIGDYLEFGVCHGTSLRIMYEELLRERLNHVRLFGFDSFDGLPYDEEGLWKEGAYKADERQVTKMLDERGVDWDRVKFVKGFYRDTLNDRLKTKLNLRKASLIMIDCDLYSSAKKALNYSKQFILDEAVIFFDDWALKFSEKMGERRAFAEFMHENQDLEATPTGTYSFRPGDLHGRVFRVSRIAA